MDRRQFARGLSLATAAVALPTSAVAMPAPEHPNDRVRRLAREIAVTLRDPAFLGFRQLTITPNGVAYGDAEQDKPADERVASHFAALADAMNELTAGAHGWSIQAGECNSGGAVKGYDGRCFTPRVIRLVNEKDPRLVTGEIIIDRSEPIERLRLQTASLRPVPRIPTMRRREAGQ